MKCLVTGGCGFIGSHLVKKLVFLGHDVIILDNMSGQGYEEQRIKDIKNNVKFVNVDICKYYEIEKYFKNIDIVFHCAAKKNVRESFINPDIFIKTNAIGTINCMKALMTYKVHRFIYSSSSSIYGGTINPKTLNHHPTPESIYGMTKLGGEHVCRIFGKHTDMRIYILRYFNIYGECGNGIINLILNNSKENKITKIYGDGNQARDYTHVDNVIKANIACAFELKLNYEIYNIGCAAKTSINELIQLMNINKSLIEYDREKEGDVLESYADIKKTERDIYKGNFVNLKEGIKLLKGIENGN